MSTTLLNIMPGLWAASTQNETYLLPISLLRRHTLWKYAIKSGKGAEKGRGLCISEHIVCIHQDDLRVNLQQEIDEAVTVQCLVETQVLEL